MTDEVIQPDQQDELRWYKIQSNHKWYAVKGCCRRCATRILVDYTNPFTGDAELITNLIFEVKE